MKQDDVKDTFLSWNINSHGVGPDWIYWSSAMKDYLRATPGQRSSGSWCFAVFNYLKLHYQRPALL